MDVRAKSLEDLGWPTVLEAWAQRCATPRGSAAVRALPWLPTREAARQRIGEIGELRELLVRGETPPLAGIVELRAALERVDKAGALEAVELVEVATSAKRLAQCRAFLRAHAELAPRLTGLTERLADLAHLYHPILDAFDADGRLVDHASEALGPLRRALAAVKGQLERRMKSLLEDEKYAPYLQDVYFTEREERCVLPVRTDGKGFVKGIVHGTSQSGQTLFIEPDEIIELNNRKKLAECDVADEERRILIRFSGWVAEETTALREGLAAAEHLDLVLGAARLAEETVACAPMVADAPGLQLLHARHPLMLLANRRCVSNDVALGAGQTMVISGPNAGGKTVSLKTAGLAVLMVRQGLHICAERGSEVGWFEGVATNIGDAQNLDLSLSTFSGHLAGLRDVLAMARAGVLVLLDEIAVGTDPEQGAALAHAYLRALAAKAPTVFITTHYERLKGLAVDDARFVNASVGFDMARLEPTFKLHLGVPGASGALAVARRMGLPAEVVDGAAALLGERAVRMDELLTNVVEQQRKLEEERAAVLAELEALEAERESVRLQKTSVVARYEKQVRAAHNDALGALKVARRELEELRQVVRHKIVEAATQPRHDDVVALARALSTQAATLAKHEPPRPALPGAALPTHKLKPGTPVIVRNMGRAVIESLETDSTGKISRVTVRMGALKAACTVEELLLDTHRAARRAREEAARDATPDKPDGLPPVVLIDGATDGRVTARTPDSTLDVRGQRIDDAVAMLDRFIDEGLLAERDAIFVVHGHGTGALKKAIRAFVATHRAVVSYRPGGDSEGGDGITVVKLRGEP